jgi:hypothetical protein
LALATQEQKPLQNLALPEKSFLKAIESPRIKKAALADVDMLFRKCFTLVGLRAQNIPNDFETLVLYEFLVENYGEHTIDEIHLAFKLAVQGKLDIGSDDVKCYENFSCLYLSSIIVAYRKWAAQTYRQLEPVIVKPEEEQKYLEGPRKEIHWGYHIDNAYLHFLSFGDEKWKTFPVDFYNQLETDELIEKGYWRRLMNGVRDYALKDLYKLKNGYQSILTKGMADDRKQFAESIRNTNLKDVEKKIDEYKSGKKDNELELMAKQRSVVKLFQAYKEKFKEHVYEPAT